MEKLFKSHPTWVRGLKRSDVFGSHTLFFVAPYVGAWIETVLTYWKSAQMSVAPYVGAWIETSKIDEESFEIESRTLRGCVD